MKSRIRVARVGCVQLIGSVPWMAALRVVSILITSTHVIFAGVGSAAAQAVLIKGGTVVDGSGAPPFIADLRLRGDVIVDVAAGLSPQAGERVITASGLVVTPGFIDMHSHADHGLAELPSAESQLRQGITTAVVGQDGRSTLPVSEFLESVERIRPGLNFAAMIGHGTVRRAVLGADYRRAALPEEIETMRALVERGMKDGAVGISSGLEYDPGFYAEPEEIERLAGAVHRYGGYYATHVRDEENGVLNAWAEAIAVGRATGIPVHISHMKLASQPVWGQAPAALRLLDDAVLEGIQVTGDWYPYTYWQSSIYVLIPDRDWGNRAKWELGLAEVGGAEHVMISDYPPDASYVGKTIAELAAKVGVDPPTLIMTMIRETGPGIGVIATAMDELDLEKLVSHPRVVICSDGGLDGSHPRGYGAFPRVLARYVRERGTLSLSEAVAKMAGHSARILGFQDRGFIGAGKKADIVILDPATIEDRGTKTRPAEAPVGVEYVIVNGEVVLEQGVLTGARPGQALRRWNWRSGAN